MVELSRTLSCVLLTSFTLSACSSGPTLTTVDKTEVDVVIEGTSEAFTKEAVYFVMTDRFVDGDLNNNYEEQGGNTQLGTFHCLGLIIRPLMWVIWVGISKV